MSVFELSGRKALVTGGAQGLGEGMARALADAGATVVIADLQEEAGRAVAKGLGEEHGFVALDVTSDEGWEKAVGEAVEHLGGLDILVNNAGIEITSLFTEIQADQVRKMLDVNFLGTALGIKHGLRAMRPGGSAGNGGSIINIASVAATIAFPGIGIYSGTKSAVERMTKVAAMEAGKLGLRRPRQLHLPRPGAHRDGCRARQRRRRARPVPSAGGRRRRRRRADPRRPARRRRRHGRRGRLPGLGRLALRHRRRAARRRRNGDVTA